LLRLVTGSGITHFSTMKIIIFFSGITGLNLMIYLI
jgi:hypothetical protein